ncbi:MAG: phosphonate metabolism protein/1,5-bisphosphokinase (PRPP-forming) PhnN [Polaromonas sp.]
MSHRLVVVIGPSGAGKDSVLQGLCADWPFAEPAHFAQRTITRPVKPDDEQHEAVDVASFEQMQQAQMFCMHWQANGLSYGIRQTELEPLEAGHWVFINGSRAYLPQVLQVWPQATVVHIGASRDVLAQRLAQRGRETEDVVAKRLSRDVALDLPAHVVSIDNNGALGDAVCALQQALRMRKKQALSSQFTP